MRPGRSLRPDRPQGLGQPRPCPQPFRHACGLEGSCPPPPRAARDPGTLWPPADARSRFPAAPPDRRALCWRTVGTRGSRAHKPRRCFPPLARGRAQVCSPRQGQTPAHSRCFANVRGRWPWAEHRACLSLSRAREGWTCLLAGSTVPGAQWVSGRRWPQTGCPGSCLLSSWTGFCLLGGGGAPGPQAWLCLWPQRQPAHTQLSVRPASSGLK